ncbi:MAG: DEAD/DEAH box helicase, partial [Candidatus Wallbacteria bacterium]|nr:DEAD/DEAH box helicase [Candidatus Wallbacteria bacterium]
AVVLTKYEPRPEASVRKVGPVLVGARKLIQPYLLRRLKTDRTVLPDLPEKTEVTEFCLFSKLQAALYKQAVDDLAEQLETLDGIQRRGVVLAFIHRFKEICNHPSQWLRDGAYQPQDSGKFLRLASLCEELAERQEKALVFTQYRQVAEALAGCLAGVFGRRGLVLTGDTRVEERRGLVERFQQDEEIPFLVLTLKTGGVGLNLTAASHVIHFDRWWNPAVENQATDRAFRIGQKRNVLVHKLVCRGTLEEKVDRLLASKQRLANELLQHDGEALLTALSNEELLEVISLDVRTALDEDLA